MSDFKVALDSISSILVDPLNESYSMPEKALACAVAILVGVSTYGIAPLAAICWRRFSHETPLPNNTYDKISSIFARILGESESIEENDEKFLKLAIDYSFLDSIIESYDRPIKDFCENVKKANKNQKTGFEKQASFFTSELLNWSELMTVISEDLETLDSDDYSKEDKSQITDLKFKYKETTDKCLRLIDQIEDQFPKLSDAVSSQPLQVEKKENRVRDVKGLLNQKNSCYMNAALQTLFVIENFGNLIPDEITKLDGENDIDFKERQKLVTQFKNLVKEYFKPNNSPHKLGKLVGQLRREIFDSPSLKSSLFMGDGLFAKLDSGDFFQLILSLTGLNFEVETKKIYTQEGAQNYDPKPEITPTGCFLLKEKGSIQDKVNKSGKLKKNRLDESFFANNGISYTTFEETNKILGNPPPLLIFQMDSTSGYVVGKKDKEIDCKDLFKNPPPGDGAKYRLVGFAQNLHQNHWVSVVYKEGDQPVKCDDSSVSPLKEDHVDFRKPAHYLVYERIGA